MTEQVKFARSSKEDLNSITKEAEKREPQLQSKRGRLTTLHVSSEAENGEPQLQNKRGTILNNIIIN